MSEYITARPQPPGNEAIQRENNLPGPPRIQIDVPLGTPYREIRDAIFSQAWQLAGTQMRAAIALGITPETISRNYRRGKKNRVVGPSDRRVNEKQNRPLGLALPFDSDGQDLQETMGAANSDAAQDGRGFSVRPLPFCQRDLDQNEEKERASTLAIINDDTERSDLW